MKRIAVLVLVALVGDRLQLPASPARDSGRSSRCRSRRRCARGRVPSTSPRADLPAGTAGRRRRSASTTRTGRCSRPARRCRCTSPSTPSAAGPRRPRALRRRRGRRPSSVTASAVVDTPIRAQPGAGARDAQQLPRVPAAADRRRPGAAVLRGPARRAAAVAGRPPVRARRPREHRTRPARSRCSTSRASTRTPRARRSSTA